MRNVLLDRSEMLALEVRGCRVFPNLTALSEAIASGRIKCIWRKGRQFFPSGYVMRHIEERDHRAARAT